MAGLYLLMEEEAANAKGGMLSEPGVQQDHMFCKEEPTHNLGMFLFA